jgi:hypothetical protein
MQELWLVFGLVPQETAGLRKQGILDHRLLSRCGKPFLMFYHLPNKSGQTLP